MEKYRDLAVFVLNNLIQIKVSAIQSATVSLFGVTAMILNAKLQEWFSESIDYIFIASMLIAFDHLLGTVVHFFYLKDWSWQKNIIGLMIKISMVVIGGLIFEGLAYITKEQDFIYLYLKMTLRLLVCLYPGMSAVKNIRIITKGRFPPIAVQEKLEGFTKDLSIKNLKDKEDERD